MSSKIPVILSEDINYISLKVSAFLQYSEVLEHSVLLSYKVRLEVWRSWYLEGSNIMSYLLTEAILLGFYMWSMPFDLFSLTSVCFLSCSPNWEENSSIKVPTIDYTSALSSLTVSDLKFLVASFQSLTFHPQIDKVWNFGILECTNKYTLPYKT